ncbi:MAG: lipocalin-like domain-containing protein [Sphingomonadales bacterium]
MKVMLRRVAHVRSGDKGNTACISVIAYAPEFYPVLVQQLTVERVAERYGALPTGPVTRYTVDAITALNFTLEGSLGGGVSRNTAIDVYGKALCAALLDVIIDVPDHLRDLLVGPKPTTDIVGSWVLVDYRRRQGDDVVLPFGDDPVGFLQYGVEGRVSATLSRRDRKRFVHPVDASWRGDPQECAEAAMTYLAYTGTYRIEGDRVEHQVEACSYPNWVGTTLTRWIDRREVAGESLLLLTTTSPDNRDDTILVSELLWGRWTRPFDNPSSGSTLG